MHGGQFAFLEIGKICAAALLLWGVFRRLYALFLRAAREMREEKEETNVLRNRK